MVSPSLRQARRGSGDLSCWTDVPGKCRGSRAVCVRNRWSHTARIQRIGAYQMNNSEKVANLIRYEEATEAIDQITDEVARDFVRFGFATVFTRHGLKSDERPKTDFDLCFFVQVLQAMARDRM